jgi:PKD repeat protein
MLAAPALAAPKIETVTVKPNKADAQVSVSVSRTRFDSGGCDARVDFGDGQGRTIDFGVAGTRNVSHTYKKNGSYKVTVKGTGATPCEGAREAPVTIAGVPEPKKAEPKKAETRKAETKKAEPKKKSPPKKAPAKKKDEKKKDEPK